MWFEEYGDVWDWHEIASYAREAMSSWSESSESESESQTESRSSSDSSETESESESKSESESADTKEAKPFGRALSMLKRSHRNLK